MIALCRILAWVAGTLLLLALGAAGILAAVFSIQGGDATLSLPHLASLLGLDSLRDAIDGWFGRPVSALFEYIYTQMPADKPGELLPEQVAVIVAYLAESNGFVAGATPLPADVAALQGMAFRR